MRLSKTDVLRSIKRYNQEVRLKELSAQGIHKLVLTTEPDRERDEVGKVVIAFGSYDPLTIGHVNLFLSGLDAVEDKEATRGSESLDELVIATSTSHIDKQINLMRNSTISDRVHAQEGFADALDNVSLAFTNTPFFIDLIPLFEQKYGKDVDLYFLVGADVMEKIVDPKSYERHDKSIDEVLPSLFRHNFIVCERQVQYKNEEGEVTSERYLNRDLILAEHPEISKYTKKMLPVDLRDNEYPDLEISILEVSSSLVRKLRGNGNETQSDENSAPWKKLEAVGISDFVDKRSLYMRGSEKYKAIVALTRAYADHFRPKGVQPLQYINALMQDLRHADEDSEFRDHVIRSYDAGIPLVKK
ncbi:hypothetical protein HN587_03450 [Candidatus Woesearchaeota archaeon]|jgi:nicotinic acid mononucleotide adenylyltransferase|nr:hypothetical protein [Candidatus Woesearchaeota archaeon]